MHLDFSPDEAPVVAVLDFFDAAVSFDVTSDSFFVFGLAFTSLPPSLITILIDCQLLTKLTLDVKSTPAQVAD
jgi:hypothetical protein